MRRLKWAAAALSLLMAAGCATSALQMAPSAPDRPWAPATTAEGDIVTGERGQSGPRGYLLPADPALAAAPELPAVDPQKTYSLAELIDLAESSNPMTRVAWNDARRAALAAGIAESAYLPRITATAIGGYQGSHGRDSTLGTTFDSSPSATGTVSALSLQWLLFDFGERGAVVDAAKQLSLIANITFTAAHQQVIYGVSLAFYANAAAKARQTAATQSMKNAETVQAAAEDRYQHGIGTVIEVAQARQGSAQARFAVVQATGAAEDAQLTLLTAVGFSPLTKLKVADVSGRKLSPSMAAPVDTIISESLARRPDVQSAYAAEKASLANVRAAKAEFMPKFFLSANGTYSSGNLDITALPAAGQQSPTVNINGNRWGGSIFAGVTIPIFDGGIRTAALSQARAEADRASAQMTQVRNDATRQIVFADNALRTSLAAYDASQSVATATQTTFDAALAAYRNGVGSITDVTLAETQLLQAKNASSDAYSTALSAAATLALSTGTLGAAPP
jgi:outer membrane protein TolC